MGRTCLILRILPEDKKSDWIFVSKELQNGVSLLGRGPMDHVTVYWPILHLAFDRAYVPIWALKASSWWKEWTEIA